MQIDKIIFTQSEEGAEPENITVTMSLKEAIWIAKVAGQQCGEGQHREIYGPLIGDLFNRYWDDGVDEAHRQHPVEVPKYPHR